ncbi:MAG: NAD(P)H:quinone oxidoreductase [Hyphomonas sp.]
MANILIAFYSRDGSTEALGRAIAEGAEADGGVVRMRRVREIVDETTMSLAPGWKEAAARMNAIYEAPTPDDAEWADAIILGSPTRFGLLASELKAFLDGLGGLWVQGKLAGKVGSAFTSSSSVHGGNEINNLTMFVPMAHFGMIIVPPGYADPVMFRAGTPYGASSVSYGAQRAAPTEQDLEAAKYQGKRVVQVARALAGKSLEVA